MRLKGLLLFLLIISVPLQFAMYHKLFVFCDTFGMTVGRRQAAALCANVGKC